MNKKRAKRERWGKIVYRCYNTTLSARCMTGTYEKIVRGAWTKIWKTLWGRGGERRWNHSTFHKSLENTRVRSYIPIAGERQGQGWCSTSYMGCLLGKQVDLESRQELICMDPGLGKFQVTSVVPWSHDMRCRRATGTPNFVRCRTWNEVFNWAWRTRFPVLLSLCIGTGYRNVPVEPN